MVILFPGTIYTFLLLQLPYFMVLSLFAVLFMLHREHPRTGTVSLTLIYPVSSTEPELAKAQGSVGERDGQRPERNNGSGVTLNVHRELLTLGSFFSFFEPFFKETIKYLA